MNNPTVLIVGAGPTGLTLACELARRDVLVRIIERSAEYPKGSRAKGLQPRSLEVFDDLGIAQQMMASGATDIIFRRFNGPEWLGDIKREIFPRDDTRYAQGLMLPQWKVEEILRGKLSGLGVQVELNTELTGFTQTDDTVIAQVKTAEGTAEISCDYMVACDGGKSATRKALGIQFEGETHETEKAFVGDVEVEGLVPDAWHMWTHPQFAFGFALCPFKCTSSWQVQAIALPDENGNLPEPSLETFQQLFAERAQMPNVKLKNATWQSLYRVNVRMADKYSVGRIFIAGDAAHAHSIAGGLGMNTGIQDAYNLGWKMAAVIKNESDASLLDTYEEERRPIAAWTLNISSERQKMMQDSVAKGGDGNFSKIGTKDTTQLNLSYRYSSLSKDLTESADALRAGDRAPDAHLANDQWLFDLYRGTHFTVLCFGVNQESADTLNKKYAGKVKAYQITDDTAARLFGYPQGFVTVRPDGYIGMTASTQQLDEVCQYLDKLTGG